MNTADTAAAWAETMAADDSHGYDQHSRWGPDYDCSSLVISAYKKAGLALTCTYTGNMRPDMLARGFRDVTGEVDLPSGAGLRRGDVLLNIVHHTALYLGGGRLVHAAGNERGGATGGRTGDQTGREITTAAYFHFPWDCVLRYAEEEAPEAPEDGGADTYVVRSGDSLWSIAERMLGSGFLYPRLQELNALTGTTIHPGQVLRLRPAGEGPKEGRREPETPGETCDAALPVLRPGDEGAAVAALQTLLLLRGASLPRWGTDGQFGPETAAALEGVCPGAEAADGPVWEKIIKG